MAKGITLQELDSSAIVNLVPYLGTTSNNGDAYSITTNIPIDVNQKFTIKFNAVSSTAPTLKINDGTSRPIKKANGNNAKLYASVYTLFSDGSSFILQGEGGEYGTAVASDVRSGKTIGTENGLVTGNLPVRATGSTTIYPSTSDQTLSSGIYDGPIYIKAGKRAASGRLPNTSDAIQITGLEFNPSLVRIKFADSTYERIIAYLEKPTGLGGKWDYYAGVMQMFDVTERIIRGGQAVPRGDVVGNSFYLVYSSGKTNIEWTAYE